MLGRCTVEERGNNIGSTAVHHIAAVRFGDTFGYYTGAVLLADLSTEIYSTCTKYSTQLNMIRTTESVCESVAIRTSAPHTRVAHSDQTDAGRKSPMDNDRYYYEQHCRRLATRGANRRSEKTVQRRVERESKVVGAMRERRPARDLSK